MWLRLLTAAVFLVLAGCAEPVDTNALAQELDSIVAQYPDATVAISVRDPSRDFTYDREGSRVFHAASTMKVPVLIEAFRLAANAELHLDDSLVVRNEFHSIVDNSTYAIGDDSDDEIYESLGQPMRIRDLLENMIVVSSNLATNLLIQELGAENIQKTSEDLGTTRMRTLRGVEDLKAYEQGLSNQATSSDLAILMLRMMQGRAVNKIADEQMVDILLRQQFNEMIPAGMPQGVRVAHKTGQITAVHHDAAIVYPIDGDPYVLVILTEGLADDTVSAQLGRQLAGAVHARLRIPSP